jgi:competence protein ComEC
VTGGAPRTWPDRDVAVVAAALVLGAWLRTPAVALVAPAVAVVRRRADVGACVLVAALVGCGLSTRAWEEVAPDRLGPFAGWATLADDPRPVGSGLRVTVEVDDERFQAFVFGSARRRLERHQAGDRVEIEGVRAALSTPHPRRAQARHVVGEIAIERVWAHAPGTPVARASNRLRVQLRDGAESAMAPGPAALFTGLVIGDDTRQAPETVDAFRSAGLSHLTAVSGQNVALVLAVVGVGLRRLRTWWRLGATFAIIGWFAVITRLEPSVLRASCMAALTAVAFATGRERSAVRLLVVTVMILVVVDPLLVWSVGFWLSVGATFGVVAIAPVIAPRLRGPRWWTTGLAVTLGAQMGVLLPSWLVFGRLPALGIAANLLAVPVAGFVMLYGLPAALLASLLPHMASAAVMTPATAGTAWIHTVATHTAELTPTGVAAVAVWVVQTLLLASAIRWRASDWA